MEGACPQGVTGSEMAAIFDLHLLAELRKCYPESEEEFDKLRQEFAKEALGADAERWRELRLPSYISLDSAPYHPWLRQVLSVPRLSKAEQDAHIRTELRKDTGKQVPDSWEPPDAWIKRHTHTQPEPAHGMVTRMKASLQGTTASASQLQESAAWLRRQARAEEAPEPGADAGADASAGTDAGTDASNAEGAGPGEQAPKTPEWLNTDDTKQKVQRIFAELQRTDSGMQLLFPQQFMPLWQVTPDVHSPIEHAVAKVKAIIKQRIRENLTSDILFKAQTYVDWVQEIVKEHLTRQPGQQYLLSAEQSIKKQKCICQVLAADYNEPVVVLFEFGRNERLKQGKQPKGDAEHHVLGSAGRWIRNSKFT